MKKIGVLNLQGAVAEHLVSLQHIDNVQGVSVKLANQLDELAGLIIPGGESTAISRLIQQNQLAEPIKRFAKQGKGIFGTCAGLILCANSDANNSDQFDQASRLVQPLQLIDISVMRNGFGRQVDSFSTTLSIVDVGEDIPAIFIRAPYIQQYAASVTPLAYYNQYCVMARNDNILVSAFHPELSDDRRVLHYFINEMC